ncbi:MAG TPA: DUF3373 family protein [Desulfopila sp.]|nr:DUF3373 family protein [Desulfopila sp.]
MVKKLSALALAGCLSLPALSAAANGTTDMAALEAKINALSGQLNELKAALEEQKKDNQETKEQVDFVEEVVIDHDYKAEDWDLAARIKFNGDFRTRLDYYNADTVLNRELENDTLWTNRLRLGLRTQVMEDVSVSARLAMFKAWGSQSGFNDDSGAMYPLFDGNVSRTPDDSALYVDRAMGTWNNIADLPVWFSIGRRPTTDGPPAHLRLGMDKRMATPVNYMDWPFDGLTLGYRFDWGNDFLGKSKLRFCYGRGFENGLQDQTNLLNDTDFAGFAWDVIDSGNRLLAMQSFMAFNLFNYPRFKNPLVNAGFAQNPLFGERETSGNLWHTGAVYMDKVSDLNYFVAGGWSQTRPDDSGLFNGMSANTDNENGYSFYAGVRYDLDDIGLKVGLEYNYGSEYWIGMAPGHDDIYQAKLSTRNSVYEIYMIYDLPAGKALTKYARTFIRLGYQRYDYDYTGSGDWNFAPMDIDDQMTAMTLQAMGMDSVESADQIYVTFEAVF